MTDSTPQFQSRRPATGRATGAPNEGWSVAAGQGRAGRKCDPERLTPTPAVVAPTERRRPVAGRGPGERGLRELLDRLSGRDLAILELVGEHRFLTTVQLERFCFADHLSLSSGARSCRRVLGRLERDRLLTRPVRWIGGLMAGSASSIWMLTSTGKRLLSLRAGRGAVGRVRPPGERFIAHYLAIGDVRLALVEAERARRLVVRQLLIEPRCWRYYTGLAGGQMVLKPDLSAITLPAADADYEDHWFIEVDRGTESLPTLLRQCRAYEAYRASGQEQHRVGVFPVVVWVVPDDHRADRLRAALSASRDIEQRLFQVTTPAALVDLIAGEAS